MNETINHPVWACFLAVTVIPAIASLLILIIQ